MKQHQFSFVQALIVAVGVLFFSGCNGEKIDSDLIDSITGKVSVDKITIDQEDFEITEGESTVLTATVLPADATDKTVSWHSSKEDVVMISNTGKAMAMAPGKSVITAKAGSKTDFITITVIANAVHVTGISLEKTTLELKVGDSETLTATVTPPDATNKNVSWTSSDATVATVENGRVTGVKPGSVTITAKTEDGGKTAECAVTVKTNLAPSVTVGSENVSAVSVVVKGKANLDSSAPSDLMVGFQYSLSEGILPSNSTTVEATDADSQYNYSRGITGLEPETTYYFRSIVRMSGQDYYGETMSFTTKALSSMIHTEDASNISAVSAVMNATFDLTDVQYTNKTIGIYYGTSAESLSNTYVAEISAMKGAIAKNWPILKPATEYFYQAYVILDNKVHKDEIKSFTTQELSSMLETKDASDIAPSSAKMNAKLDLTDVQRTMMEYGFFWGTSKDSQTSYVKGGEIGENAYSASLNGLTHKTQYWYKSYLKIDGQIFYGEVKTFTTDVVTVTGVTLNRTQYTFNTIGNTLTLTPTVSPTDATNKAVSWKSSKTSVATVDTNGKVTAKGNGTATITVTTNDQSKTATCTITVAQLVTGITLDKTSVNLNEGETITLTPTISPNNANDKSVTWSSDNSSVAIVDQNGLVTAMSAGKATIRATTNDGSRKSASCSVTVGNLSVNGCANCYIVSSAGSYYFPPVKGCSNDSVGSISSVVVLWESYGTSTAPSVGSIISDVLYRNNTIFFSTPSTLNSGNAVVAAKDAGGNILWSWHIWVCRGYNPNTSAQNYNYNAGKVMDRNLGATSATPGDAGALGLLYQWGRKDPFLGSSDILTGILAASTLSWPSPIESDNNSGNISYTIANPTIFITSTESNNYDWIFSSGPDVNKTRWQSYKTIYDPCPPGWKVPQGGDSGLWKTAVGSKWDGYVNFSTKKRGYECSGVFGGARSIWYPGIFPLRCTNGNLGNGTYYWSCTSCNNEAYCVEFAGSSQARLTDHSYRANGFSIRCQKVE